jgi:DNA polymerase III epsilon subunit-like protein
MATDLLFLDVETTGLDARAHSVISIGAIRTDDTGAVVKATLNMKVRPTTAVDPRAAAVNGYTEEAWLDAADPETAAAALASLAQGTQIVGHCVWFDEGFCRSLLNANGHAAPWDHRWVDTQSLAHLLKERYPDLKRTSLQAVCDVMGWSRSAAHDAYEDAELARQLYLATRRLVAEGGGEVESMAAREPAA